MNNQESLAFFQQLAYNANDIQCVKLANKSDFTDIDADFILNYADKNSEILDLGSGTGLIVNKIYDKIKRIDCVDAYKEFTKFIIKSPNVNVYNVLLKDFKPDKKYDMISIFGTMHFFNEREAQELYKYYFKYLKHDGKIIIKNQFGIEQDVTVEGYSQEQKTEYYAQYRQINKEVSILSNIGYKNIEVFDIYPPECNRWQNTHFYAIVGGV